MYAKPKGIGNPIPFDKASNAIINIQHEFIIAMGEKALYNNAFVQWESGQPRIVCEESVKINLVDIERNELVVLNINVEFKGTLNEQLNDLYFIKGLTLNKELIIDGHSIPYNAFKFDSGEHLSKRISDLEQLKQRLKYYGIKTDLNLESITEEDYVKLSLLMDEKPSIKKYNINLVETNICTMKIANITILLLVEKDNKRGYYKLKSFFEDTWNVVYYLPETDESTHMSQFLILDKESLLANNINVIKIMDDIKTHHHDNKNMGYVSTFLLEVIKAYDESGTQRTELKNLIKNLSEWIFEQCMEGYAFLNVAQVKYRLGQLDEKDIHRIMEIKKLNNNDLEIQAGASILLGKKEEAKLLILEMNQEQKELFMTYPIYRLLEDD